MRRGIFIFFSVMFLLFSSPSESQSAEPNWSSISKKTITLFYPGQTSWEFLNSRDHGLGARNIKRVKKSCNKCHVDESGVFDLMADEIATGKKKKKKTKAPFEPKPLPGKKGFMDAEVQAAFDANFIYMKVSWKSIGASSKDATLAGENLADRISIQFNKKHKHFKKYGCFIACHDTNRYMPLSPSKDMVKANPYYSKIKRDEVKLYAFYTRNQKQDGKNKLWEWDDFIDKGSLTALTSEGMMDLWEAEFKGSKVEAEDEWIFEDRQKDKQGDLEASGGWKNGSYSVVFKRKLSTGDKYDVELASGDTITLGIAIHDGKMGGRQHYVTFPITLGIGAKGDIKAKKIN
ncbi:MAG: hypothetical protein KAT46_00760 [Deltaproteobacteria bacterium]|nr:hypothetical protein [Deltaproteobacteria bacterium]